MKSAVKSFPLIAAALEELKLTFRGKSPRTRTTYATGLNVFEQFLRDGGIDPAAVTTDRLPENCLEEFYLWLVDRQGRQMQSTVNTYMSSARSLLRFLARRDLAPHISLEKSLEQVRAVAVKSVYKAPRIEGNLALIVDFAKSLPPPERGRSDPNIRLRILRDRALLHTAYCTGMRREEIVRLNCRDVQGGVATEAIVTGKGGRERVVFFDEETLASIREYLGERNDRFAPLFIRHRGQAKDPGRNGEGLRLSSQTLWTIVKRYAKAAGIRASTHDFRHLKATTLLNRGASLSEVQDILGHASPATTKLIYAHYDVARLREAFYKFSVPASEAAEAAPKRRR